MGGVALKRCFLTDVMSRHPQKMVLLGTSSSFTCARRGEQACPSSPEQTSCCWAPYCRFGGVHPGTTPWMSLRSSAERGTGSVWNGKIFKRQNQTAFYFLRLIIHQRPSSPSGPYSLTPSWSVANTSLSLGSTPTPPHLLCLRCCRDSTPTQPLLFLGFVGIYLEEVGKGTE